MCFVGLPPSHLRVICGRDWLVRLGSGVKVSMVRTWEISFSLHNQYGVLLLFLSHVLGHFGAMMAIVCLQLLIYTVAVY